MKAVFNCSVMVAVSVGELFDSVTTVLVANAKGPSAPPTRAEASIWPV